MLLYQDLFSTQFIGEADTGPPQLGMIRGQQGDKRSAGHREITREDIVVGWGSAGTRLPKTTYILVGQDWIH